MEENRTAGQRTQRRKRRSGIASFFKVVGTLLVIGVCTALIFFGIFMTYVHTTLEPELDVDASAYTLKQSSILYYQDKNTGEWVEMEKLHGSENRTLVEFADIPDYVWKALVSIEDERFFEHHGVDWKSTAKSVFDMLRGADSTRGASTLTQQVIKNLTGENEVTIRRKVLEIFRALRFAENYSREEILEMYLNIVYFGRGAYGIDAAAETYFGKEMSELTVAEAADIVGITQNPWQNDPKLHPQHNHDRQQTVLYKMHELGYLDDAAYEAAKNEKLVFVWDDDYVATEDTETAQSSTDSYYSYFVEQVFNDVVNDLMEEKGYSKATAKDMLYTGGYHIYCTVDPDIQRIIEEVYGDRGNLNYTSANGEQLQSGMTIVDNATGNVVAIAGRVGERGGAFEWSYASNPRPCGSAVKPLSVYAPALDSGAITAASVLDDYPVMERNGKPWPVNAYESYYGLVTLTDALRNSSNPCAVRALEKLTLAASYAFMTEKLGFTTLVHSDLDYGPLGMGGMTYGVTTVEMAAAYATFANNGVYTRPRTYTQVLDSADNVVLDNTTQSWVALKESTVYTINELLKGVVRNGTGTMAAFQGMTIAGKTGTTSNGNDRYFCGYTPYYTGAVWVGYDTPTRISVGGNPAATLWNKVMSRVHANLPNADFPTTSEGMIQVTTCAQTGLLAGSGCPTQRVMVPRGSAPTLTCDGHIPVNVCKESGLIVSEFCPAESVTSVTMLDFNAHNVAQGFGYRRSIIMRGMTESELATYEAQLEAGQISSIPSGNPIKAKDSGSLYQDMLACGTCTVHTEPVIPELPDPPWEEEPGEAGETGQTVDGEESHPGDGGFLDWLINGIGGNDDDGN